MAGTQTIVDELLMDEFGVDEADLANPDVLPLRRKAKRCVRRQARFIWNFRDWPWKQNPSNETVTIAANTSSVALETASFASNPFGKITRPSLTNPPNAPPLIWTPQAVMNDLLQLQRRTGPPTRYSVIGRDTAGAGAGTLFAVYPIPTVDTDVILSFIRTQLSIGDAGDPDDAEGDEIDIIPAEFHDTVIYEGALLRLMQLNGSDGIQQQSEIYKAALKSMVVNERPGREAPHRIPPYGVGRIFN